MVPRYPSRKWWDLEWSSAPCKVSDLMYFIAHGQKFGKENLSVKGESPNATDQVSTPSFLVGPKEAFRNHREGLGMST